MTPGTVARQAPLSWGFSRQEHQSGLPCPPPGDLPTPGTNLCLLHWQADSFTTESAEKPPSTSMFQLNEWDLNIDWAGICRSHETSQLSGAPSTTWSRNLLFTVTWSGYQEAFFFLLLIDITQRKCVGNKYTQARSWTNQLTKLRDLGQPWQKNEGQTWNLS